MVVTLLANLPTLLDLERLWRESATYSHGYLVLPLAAALWWHSRNLIPPAQGRGRTAGMVLLAGAAAGILLSQLTLLQTGAAALLPIAVGAAACAAAGWRVARHTLVPLALLYCATPVASVATPWLQSLSAVVSTFGSSLLGFPSARYGHYISIPGGGVFEVAAGCSGTNFLLVSLVMGLLLGAWHRSGLRQRGVIIGAAVAVALLANWARIILLVVVGHIHGMEHPLIAGEHYTLGWLVFAGSLVLLVVFVEWRVSRSKEGPAVPEAALSLVRPPAWRAPSMIALSGPLALLALSVATPPVSAEEAMAVVQPPAGCHAGEIAAGAWKPAFSAPDRELFAEYRCSNQRVSVYRNQYFTQSPGRELISTQNEILPSQWSLAGWSGEGVEAGERWLIGRDANKQAWLVRQYFEIAGRRVAQPRQVKALQLVQRLRIRPDMGAFTQLWTRCDGDCVAEARLLAQFEPGDPAE